jgi:hypothetical protein
MGSPRRAALAVAVVLALVAAGCGSGTAVEAQAVQSAAAEGAALARSYAQGDLAGAFVRVHAAESAGAARRTAEPLPEGRLHDLAERAAADIDRIPGASAAELAGLRTRLEAVARRGEAIGRRAG